MLYIVWVRVIEVLVELFLNEFKKDFGYVIVLCSYIIDNCSFFSFYCGDFIKLLLVVILELGW